MDDSPENYSERRRKMCLAGNSIAAASNFYWPGTSLSFTVAVLNLKLEFPLSDPNVGGHVGEKRQPTQQYCCLTSQTCECGTNGKASGQLPGGSMRLE
jgi:hypothetical protein